MMLKYVFCPVKNRGYQWSSCGNTYFKGYIMLDGTDQVLSGQEAASAIEKDVSTEEDLRSFLAGTDGCFAIAKITENGMLLAVDRARSMPIYYVQSMQMASDSAEKLRCEAGILKEDTDPRMMTEFQGSDYVEFENTVYKRIKQLDAGQMAVLSDGAAQVSYYFRHYNRIVEGTREEILDRLYQTSVSVFERIKKQIAGRPVVLSLSGGYDSRYVATMLKVVGVENISCYTYGKKGSFETIQSKKVADALGYRWTCVEYDDALIEDAITDTEYFSYCNEHDYTIYLQNYPAVKKLHNENWFEKGSVFLTGLCGDMPTGNYVTEEGPGTCYSTETIAQTLYRRKFTRGKLSEENKTFFTQNYIHKAEQVGLAVTDYQSYIQVLDAIETCGRHSRCFLHMNRAHEFFGYEWILPFWDKQLLQFWYCVPFRYRIRQGLYEQFLTERLCKDYGIGTLKTRVTYSRNKVVSKIKHIGGSVLVYLCFKTGHPFRRSYDYNNFSYGEYLLYKKLKNRKKFNYQKAGITYLLNRYLCEQRYTKEKN